MNAEPSLKVGDYEIVGVLGQGGMGNVFKVRNVITDRIEAMKILLPDLANQQELGDRFRREIKLLASLDHPNIAGLRTALTWDNSLVMIMEYVEGTTLAARVMLGALPLGDAVDYAEQVLAALAYAHSRHIIHRDVKPANIMLTPQYTVKLMDFGIARGANDPVLTQTGTTLGSPCYISPEQIKGEPVDERSDLYSFGITLYELVTGRRPFEGDNNYSIMAAQLNKQPQPPVILGMDLPARLNEIILRAMAKNPAQRFQSADEFCQALRHLAIERQRAANIRDPATVLYSAAAGTTLGITRPVAEENRGAPVNMQTAMQTQPQSAQQGRLHQNAPIPVSTALPSHRALYMSLGAFTVLVVLVAAGLYFPLRTHSDSGSSRDLKNVPSPHTRNLDTKSLANKGVDTKSPEAKNPGWEAVDARPAPVSPNSTDTTEPVPNSQPAEGQGASEDSSGEKQQLASPNRPAAANRGMKVTSQASKEQSLPHTPGPVPPLNPLTNESGGPLPPEGHVLAPPANVVSAPVVIDQTALQQLTHDLDLLSSRADSVNDTLTALRESERSQGMSLRGDVAASQQRMQKYLGRAESALSNNDASGARRYLELAETEVENLERFLGR